MEHEHSFYAGFIALALLAAMLMALAMVGVA